MSDVHTHEQDHGGTTHTHEHGTHNHDHVEHRHPHEHGGEPHEHVHVHDAAVEQVHEHAH